MGVNLSPIVTAKEIELEDLRGRTVAIDAYNTIFQFLSIIRQPDGKPLMDAEGRVTSHLSGLLYRTANLIEAGIEPSFVFDGKPNELKAGTIEERIARREKAKQEYEAALAEGDMKKAFSKAQQTSRMTPEILETSKQLLTLMGIPVIQAPSDGEAQAAYMCGKGDVYAAASQDFDSILFGAPLLVRNLTISGRRKVPGKQLYRDVKTEIIDSEEMLQSLGVTREQLVDVCMMIGTDFNTGVNGIGPKKGLKLIQKHGSLEKVMEETDIEIPEYEEVREIFLNGPKSDDYSVKVGEMDKDGVLDLMTGYGFSEDRVSTVIAKIEAARKAESNRRKQKSLDAWFRYHDRRPSARCGGVPPGVCRLCGPHAHRILRGQGGRVGQADGDRRSQDGQVLRHPPMVCRGLDVREQEAVV
jgi:flap endonuclease-1